MDILNLKDKIATILSKADIETKRWDDLQPTDPEYMLYSPKPVGYHDTNEQRFLFQNILVGYTPDQTILDIGCGRGDMCNFIKEFYDLALSYDAKPLYTGIDHNPLMFDAAKSRYDYDIQLGAFEPSRLNNHDWVVAAGLFTQRRCVTEDADLQKLFIDVHHMCELSDSVVAFNLLSPINNKHHEGFFYVHPGLVLDMLIEKYRYVSLRHNYSNDVYTVIIYKF